MLNILWTGCDNYFVQYWWSSLLTISLSLQYISTLRLLTWDANWTCLMTGLVLEPITEDLDIVSQLYCYDALSHDAICDVTKTPPGHPAPWKSWRELRMEDCNMRGSIWPTIILSVTRASSSGKVSHAFKLTCVTPILNNKKTLERDNLIIGLMFKKLSFVAIHVCRTYCIQAHSTYCVY